jgi:ABC-type cobalamin transport system permease subunit
MIVVVASTRKDVFDVVTWEQKYYCTIDQVQVLLWMKGAFVGISLRNAALLVLWFSSDINKYSIPSRFHTW